MHDYRDTKILGLSRMMSILRKPFSSFEQYDNMGAGLLALTFALIQHSLWALEVVLCIAWVSQDMMFGDQGFLGNWLSTRLCLSYLAEIRAHSSFRGTT